jgi:hypothetical protein
MGRRRPTLSAWGFGAESVDEPEGDLSVVEADSAAEERQSALWEQFERTELATDAEEGSTANDASAEPRNAVLDIDYVANFAQALQDRNPDLVARCLIVAERKDDLAFIRGISGTVFSDCIRLLQPGNMIERLASAHLEIEDAVAKNMGLAPMRKVAWEHASLLQEIVALRRSAGIHLGLDDYRELLRAARDLGQKNMAVRLWRHMLGDGLTPDTACYNYYMSASIFNGVYDARARQNVRVIKFHMLARRQQLLGRPFANYRVGDGGVKLRTLKTFGEMLKVGAIANEESFRNVIMATAREGDMATVKATLKRVWSIDVDALQAGDADETSLAPKEMDRSSPLYPTQQLLFAIAHAFGINNDVPAALRTVDFVARHYHLDIDVATWNQLFEWTFVLATPRTGAKSQKDGSKRGQLPLPSVMSLWQTMISAPYNVQPTMGMYNHLIKNLCDRDMPFMIMEKMSEARQISLASRKKRDLAWDRLRNRVLAEKDHPPNRIEPTQAPPSSAESTRTAGFSNEALRKDWEYFSVIYHRDVFWLCRWIRLLLVTSGTRACTDISGDWSLRALPALLWEWRLLTPPTIRYEVPGGQVEFDMRTTEERQAHKASKAERWKTQDEILDRIPLGIGEWWVRRRKSKEGELTEDTDRKVDYGGWE